MARHKRKNKFDELSILSRARDAMMLSFRQLAFEAQALGRPRYRCIPKMHILDDSFRDTWESHFNDGCYMTFLDEESMRFFKQISLKLRPANSGRGLQRWLMQFVVEAFGA